LVWYVFDMDSMQPNYIQINIFDIQEGDDKQKER